ncbi:B3 domain-containing protein REM16-like [Wolffia australiana]
MAPGESNFFKIILADVDTERLSLPRKFLGKLKTQQLPETVELEDFADRRWPVKLKKTGSAVFLDEGWERFAAAHSLQPTDFLLFSFTGGSRFTVVVFAPHGGEKQHSPPPQVLVPATAHPERADRWLEKKMTTTRPLIFPKVQGSLAKRLRKRAILVAEELNLSRPAFVIVLQPSHVSGKFQILVPSKFAVKYMAGDEGRAFFKSNGGRWEVRYCRWSSRTGLTSGWKIFVEENQLAAEDIIVFELTSSRSTICRFNFTTFRAGNGYGLLRPLPSL